MSHPPADRRRTIGPHTWLASFAIATVFGLVVALQRWYGNTGPNKPPSFWDARVIQPQLIPWYAWAAIAPLLMLVLDRLPLRELRAWRRAALYAALAIVAIVVQATLAGFALGWWWSFPSPVPVNPAWHIAFELRNRIAVSALIVWLITATYHATVRASRSATKQWPPRRNPCPRRRRHPRRPPRRQRPALWHCERPTASGSSTLTPSTGSKPTAITWSCTLGRQAIAYGKRSRLSSAGSHLTCSSA